MNHVYKFVFIPVILFILGFPKMSSIKLISTGRLILENDWTSTEVLFSVDDQNRDISIFSISPMRLARISHEKINEIDLSHLELGQAKPSDLFFDNTGNIWLLIPENKIEIIWYKNGVIEENNMSYINPAYKTIINDTYKISLNSNCFTGSACMQVVQDDKVIDFARFPEVFTKIGFIRSSPIAADQNSVYIGQHYSGVISRYDLNGMLIYAIPTIRSIKHVPVQEIKYRERKSFFGTKRQTTFITRYKEATNAILDIDVNNSLLITLFSGTKKKTGRYLDFYNKNNGQLVDSIDLETLVESKVFGLEVVEESIYLLSQDLDHRFVISEFKISLQ